MMMRVLYEIPAQSLLRTSNHGESFQNTRQVLTLYRMTPCVMRCKYSRVGSTQFPSPSPLLPPMVPSRYLPPAAGFQLGRMVITPTRKPSLIESARSKRRDGLRKRLQSYWKQRRMRMEDLKLGGGTQHGGGRGGRNGEKVRRAWSAWGQKGLLLYCNEKRVC